MNERMTDEQYYAWKTWIAADKAVWNRLMAFHEVPSQENLDNKLMILQMRDEANNQCAKLGVPNFKTCEIIDYDS